ncbi:PilL N-terminal domain-containing protein [Kushneria indalinina]|uniref:Type IV pili sensor histidine kinase/response regulator n=1 Tax=Kushneria indalinina DSM 14324 TaxID=1122140 RepID=A0A3D9DRL1_9GAMM|nr:PilL N-terminal domain-containing protein [Kushneria indalinina]REC93350.1 type IV pili sensor histidine kinase/response regulator [Kushneria indalinina DSM 14324]
MSPFQCQKNYIVPLAFLVALTAGCAQQQQKGASESERLAAEYPDSGKMTVGHANQPTTKIIATGMDQPTHDVGPDIYRTHDEESVEVVRGGRYSLVAADATKQQRNLLEQTINVSIPASMNPSVEDGLRYTLQHTGYSLCAPQGRPQELLYSRSLPAAHFQLGPMPLREALQVLAGSAFELQADPIARTICYQVRDQRVVKGADHG